MFGMAVMMSIACFVQLVHAEIAGYSAGVLFSDWLYEYNLIFYALGMVLFLLPLFFGYTFMLKKEMLKIRERNIYTKILFFLIVVIFDFAALMGEAYALMTLAWPDDIRPRVLLYFTWFGWPIILLIFMIAMFVKNIKKTDAPLNN